jgi:hypothetical protein
MNDGYSRQSNRVFTSTRHLNALITLARTTHLVGLSLQQIVQMVRLHPRLLQNTPCSLYFLSVAVTLEAARARSKDSLATVQKTPQPSSLILIVSPLEKMFFCSENYCHLMNKAFYYGQVGCFWTHIDASNFLHAAGSIRGWFSGRCCEQGSSPQQQKPLQHRLYVCKS